MNKINGNTLSMILAIFATVTVLALAYQLTQCPCDRIPGSWLLGEEVREPVEDWSFVNESGLCQIQVTAVLPHSVNLNCMSANAKLYLSCASCEGKYWSTAALTHPNARIRIDESIYPVRITRVEAASELDLAWKARALKTGRGGDSPRMQGWWSFELVSR